MKRKRERDRKIAIDRYSSGERITTIARSMGYSRQWVHKWIQRHEGADEAPERLVLRAELLLVAPVLDGGQRDLLRRLTPSAFDDDKAHWAACLAEDSALRGDAGNARQYAEQAAKALEEQLVSAPVTTAVAAMALARSRSS